MGIFKIPEKIYMKLRQLVLRRKSKQLIFRLFSNDRPGRYAFVRSLYCGIRNHKYLFAAVIILIILMVSMSVSMYNKINGMEQGIYSAMSNLETCMQMRRDLIPQLTMFVNDFIRHENKVYSHSADVRAGFLKPPAGKGPEQNDINKIFDLSKIFAVAEGYPQLMANETFQVLMNKAAEVEKEILDKRIIYNEKAYEFNKFITSFPHMIYAFFYGYSCFGYLQQENMPGWEYTEAFK